MSEPAPGTGDARVDEALRGIVDLDDVPTDGHAERLAAAHAALQDVLSSPDESVPKTSSDPTA